MDRKSARGMENIAFLSVDTTLVVFRGVLRLLHNPIEGLVYFPKNFAIFFIFLVTLNL